MCGVGRGILVITTEEIEEDRALRQSLQLPSLVNILFSLCFWLRRLCTDGSKAMKNCIKSRQFPHQLMSPFPLDVTNTATKTIHQSTTTTTTTTTTSRNKNLLLLSQLFDLTILKQKQRVVANTSNEFYKLRTIGWELRVLSLIQAAIRPLAELYLDTLVRFLSTSKRQWEVELRGWGRRLSGNRIREPEPELGHEQGLSTLSGPGSHATYNCELKESDIEIERDGKDLQILASSNTRSLDTTTCSVVVTKLLVAVIIAHLSWQSLARHTFCVVQGTSISRRRRGVVVEGFVVVGGRSGSSSAKRRSSSSALQELGGGRILRTKEIWEEEEEDEAEDESTMGAVWWMTAGFLSSSSSSVFRPCVVGDKDGLCGKNYANSLGR